MGDANNDDLRVDFDSRLKLRFYGSMATSDAGLLAYCELNEASGLSALSGILHHHRPAFWNLRNKYVAAERLPKTELLGTGEPRPSVSGPEETSVLADRLRQGP